MKKFLSMILAIVIMCAIAIPMVGAEGINEAVPVVYSAPDTFILNIPAQVVVGEPAQFSVADLNMRDTKKLEVSIGGLDDFDEVHLADESNPANTLPVYFFTEDGRRLSAANNTFATFINNEGYTVHTVLASLTSADTV